MRTLVLAVATAAGLMTVAPSLAEEASRYQLQPSGDGFVRMDTQTGQMSLCSQAAGKLDCKPVSDERTAYADRIEEMSRRIEALEKRVAELEKAGATSGLPSDEEFERTMGYMERFFRRFIGVVHDLQKEYGPDFGREPDRT